jgi:hypothetical protein
MPKDKPKSLEDFPQFVVSAVRRGKTSTAGYTRFELEGKFDDIIVNEIDPHWFWLMFGKNACLCATLQSLNKETRTATLTCDVRDEPRVAGETLAYLSPRWQGYHVWMVLDPAWGEKTISGSGCGRGGLRRGRDITCRRPRGESVDEAGTCRRARGGQSALSGERPKPAA